MKIRYMNDRKIPAKVFVGQDMTGKMTTLAPGQSQVFDLEMPENAVVFVKAWETGVVFISWTEGEE